MEFAAVGGAAAGGEDEAPAGAAVGPDGDAGAALSDCCSGCRATDGLTEAPSLLLGGGAAVGEAGAWVSGRVGGLEGSWCWFDWDEDGG